MQRRYPWSTPRFSEASLYIIQLVFHQFYTSTLLSFIVLILFPVNCILCIWQYITWVSSLITTEFAAHEGRTWSLQKFLRLTKKGWNAYNLYTNRLSFWPIYHRRSTDIPPTINGQRIGRVSAAISTEISADCRSICRPSLGRYLGWYIGRYVHRHISADISTDTRPICRPTYRPTLGR